MEASSYKNIRVIWIDENINSNENQKYLKQLKNMSNDIKGYKLLDEGFESVCGKNQDDKFT